MIRAVVDVGSNSVLVLIAELNSGGWRVLTDRSEVTALGEETRTSGILGEEGIRATLAAIKRAFSTARRLGCNTTIAAATMAVRIGSNREEFLARAAAQGTPISVLSGDAEARFGLEAVLHDPMFSSEEQLSIIDIGGHSTELVTAFRSADAAKVSFRRSYPVGTLGLREAILRNESPTSLDLLRACSDIDETIAMEFLPGLAGTAVVLGATGTNLVSIIGHRKKWMPRLVDGKVLTYEEVGKAIASLCALTDAGRGSLCGIEKGRERTIHIGALILERFLHSIHVDSCRVSVRGWRYALLDHDLTDADLFSVRSC